uniref:Uncharacterized protein n=1 Tax=Gopherus agassizii TaxID=38772 RepID=A0A452HTR4_9SAUR
FRSWPPTENPRLYRACPAPCMPWFHAAPRSSGMALLGLLCIRGSQGAPHAASCPSTSSAAPIGWELQLVGAGVVAPADGSVCRAV